MRETLFIILVLVTCAAGYAWEYGSLTPCGKASDAEIDAYYRNLDARIDALVGRPSQLSITILASFQTEVGVRLVGTEVYYVRLGRSYWADYNRHPWPHPAHPDLVRHAPLDPALAARVRRLYRGAIFWTIPRWDGGLDGETYRFTTPILGCGQAWSPRPGTRNARLVDLQALLAKHAQQTTPDARRRSEMAIAATLDALR